MTTMLVEVYDAVKDVGACDEKSRAAASAIASYENRFNKIESDLPVVKWMVGAILAGVVSLFLNAFF